MLSLHALEICFIMKLCTAADYQSAYRARPCLSRPPVMACPYLGDDFANKTIANKRIIISWNGSPRRKWELQRRARYLPLPCAGLDLVLGFLGAGLIPGHVPALQILMVIKKIISWLFCSCICALQRLPETDKSHKCISHSFSSVQLVCIKWKLSYLAVFSSCLFGPGIIKVYSNI